MENDNIIKLPFENGECGEFEILDSIEYDGNEYVVLLSVNDTDKANEVIILQIEETCDEDEESYIGVDDPDVLDAVFEIFKENNYDDFDFAI